MLKLWIQMQWMDLLKKFMILFREIMDEYKYRINFLMHYWYSPFFLNNLKYKFNKNLYVALIKKA